MFETLKSVSKLIPEELLPPRKMRDVALTAGGMGALLLGRKMVGLGMFTKGALGLEQAWREAHPDFDGGLAERWEAAISFYEATHAESTNRKLHVIGIPMILGGAAGLLLLRPYRPVWFIAASSFTTGWALNIVGHALFEKNAPAFSDDPLSFIAGPVWDFKQGGKARARAGQDSEGTREPDEVLTAERINVKGAAAAA